MSTLAKRRLISAVIILFLMVAVIYMVEAAGHSTMVGRVIHEFCGVSL